jgi:tripartite-type tricarboxylate transporter receptor subunit TctC
MRPERGAHPGAAQRTDCQGNRLAGVRGVCLVRAVRTERNAARPDTLTTALDKALDDDTVRKRLSDLGCEIPDKSRRGQAALASLVKSEVARWSTIIRAVNVKGK